MFYWNILDTVATESKYYLKLLSCEIVKIFYAAAYDYSFLKIHVKLICLKIFTSDNALIINIVIVTVTIIVQ